MTRSKLKIILVIGILLFSNLLVLNPANADSHILPEIGSDNPTPAIDGNITRQEWNTSVSFSTTLHNQETTVFVTTNTSHLFIGFNMSSSNFNPVNDTVPVGVDYELGYNNQTHDWFALVLDNNIDKAVSSNSIGTEDSPDDAIVIDQYESGTYDAFADGNSSQVFIPDETLTYTGPSNTTVVSGSNGTLDVTSDRNITSDQVYYEISKPIAEMDTAGHDFMLSKLGILQFRLYQWKNAQANDTLTQTTGSIDNSEWFSLRINDTGNGVSTQTPGNTTINIVRNSVESNQFDGIKTLAKLYGFNIETTATPANTSYKDYDLNLFVFDDESSISNDELDRLVQYISAGGNVIILLGDTDRASTIANEFELDYLSNQVLTPVNENESRSELNITGFSEVVPFLSGDGVLTNRTANNVQISSSALNLSRALDSSNQYILNQEYMVYDLFSAPSDAVYDSTGDGIANDTESFDEELSLGVAFDFVKGGRAGLFPTDNIFLDGNVASSDNFLYLLRMIPWNSKIVDTIEITSADTDKRTVKEDGQLTVSVNMTDVFGDVIESESTVTVTLRLADNPVANYELSQVGDTSIYEATIDIPQNGFMELEITGKVPGSGFAESDDLDIFVEAKVVSFNDLSELSIIVITLFGISLIALFVVYMRVREY